MQKFKAILFFKEIYCPSGERCPLLNDTRSWTFMANEIQTILDSEVCFRLHKAKIFCKCFSFKFESFMRERDRHGIIGISQAISTGNQHNGIATAAAEGQIALGNAGYVGVRGYLALAAPLSSSHHNGHGHHQHRNRSRGAGGAAGNNNAGGTGAITSPPTPNNRQTTPPAGRSHSAVASPSGPIGAATATTLSAAAVVNGSQANVVSGNEKKPLSNGLTTSECATNNGENREGTTAQPSAATGSPQQPAPTTASTFAENE